MLEQIIGNHYQRWFVDRIAIIIGRSLAPISITILGGFIGILTVPALASQQNILAIILLLISGYLDTLDGNVARKNNQASDLGTVLDILVDRIVEFSVILGLWLIQPNNRSLMCILMLGSILLCVTSFLIVGIFTTNNSHKSFHYSRGIIERAEAFIFFILMILFSRYFIFLSSLFIILVLITTIVRVYEFSRIPQVQNDH